MTWVAVAVGGASILGGLIGSSGSKKAAKQQAQAAQQAAALQQQQYQQTRQDLMPYAQSGNLAINKLNYLLGLAPLPSSQGQMAQPTREQFTKTGMNKFLGRETTAFDQSGFDNAMRQYQASLMGGIEPGADMGSLLEPFSLDKFQQSPAYQFNLEQGLDAINKATRARGKNYAPATLQDIGRYSQGLASNEFLNAYNMYNQDQGNIYSRLMGNAQLGQNAAAQTGAYGNQAANAAGGYMTDAGSAMSAGTMGQANAWSGALSNLGDAFDIWQQNRALTAPSYVPQGVNFSPASAGQMQEMLGPWY